jgi:trehalose utilization protein
MTSQPMTGLVYDSPNYRWNQNLPALRTITDSIPDGRFDVSDDMADLENLAVTDTDVLVFGSGFLRQIKHEDGRIEYVDALTAAAQAAVLGFVRAGGGLVAFHTAAWHIDGDVLDLIGGHANAHPPLTDELLEVAVATRHPVTEGVAEVFTVPDEFYLSAWTRSIEVLAVASRFGVTMPMAWTNAYGAGRVFYSTLGHSAATFEQPAIQAMVRNALTWAAATTGEKVPA